ncbi:mucin-2-like isoform X2 [Scylla paramamosain]|uniref:mucin-2-like isoform X2 n=1 Tax=Scylla paramamosain TaxID=85552 RepID=UPI003082B6A5
MRVGSSRAAMQEGEKRTVSKPAWQLCPRGWPRSPDHPLASRYPPVVSCGLSTTIGTAKTEQQQQQQQGAAPSLPPTSECSSPPGSPTPTGYQTSAPSSREGSPTPRRKVRRTPLGKVSGSGMIEVVPGKAPQGTAMWRPRPDSSRDSAVPPWADPNAQAPPPPSQVYNPLSPTSQRRQMKLSAPTSSAVEANPSPKHFNRPTPGASPVMARRSLSRNSGPHRARSVDSIARTPPWADHKLRHTPRTESPLSASTKAKATSSTSLEKAEEFTVVSASSETHVTVREQQSAVELTIGCPAPGVGSHGVVNGTQQLPSPLVSPTPSAESQPVPGSLSQEQSSPTPWRKQRAAGANVTPAHQQQPAHPPAASAAPDSVLTTTGAITTPASQQAPWRKGRGETVQLSQSSSDKPASIAPETARQEGTGTNSQPNWRKQKTKSRPSDTSKVSTAAQSQALSSAGATTSQPIPSATVDGSASKTTLHQVSVTSSATSSASTEAASKSTQQIPSVGQTVADTSVITSTISSHQSASQSAHSVNVVNTKKSIVSASTSSSVVTSKGERNAISQADSSQISASSTAVSTPPSSTAADLTPTKGPGGSGTEPPVGPPEPPQRSDSSGASVKNKRDFPSTPTLTSSPVAAAPRHSAAGHTSDTQINKPDSVPGTSQVPLPPKEIVGTLSQSTPSQVRDSFSPTPTMPIPTPPPEPSANLVKAGGVTQSPQTAPGDKSSETTPQTDYTAAMKDPGPLPPPPPVTDMSLESIEANPTFPPPPASIQDERMRGLPPPMRELPKEELGPENEEYVRESVTKRIKAFEKQASEEEQPALERRQHVARPVAPWVKKTSAGPVQHDTYWDMTSPEERTDGIPVPPVQASTPAPAPAPAPPPPPPPAQTKLERTMSPTRPAQTKAPVSASPPGPAVRFSPCPPKSQPGGVVKSLSTSRPRVVPQRQRSVSTGDYIANYIIPDDLCKMPAEGSAPIATEPILPPSPVKEEPLFDPWCDPANPRTITFQDVSAAAFKIKSGIMNTPCTRSHLSNVTDMEIFFKKEFNQCTGSFKERGARYTLLMLTPEQQKKGVIAASAGNHALALSYHGQDLGIPVTVVMPLVAPIMKVQACRQHGANVIVRGKDIGECREHALRLSKEQDLLYINGYDHPHIIAGQGTMGLEIVEQVPNIDAVVIPVGGGGLIAGVALAVKALYPHVKVIGVESERCASFSGAMRAGKPVYVKAESTLADGLAVPKVGVNAFATACQLVDKVVTVKEEWIAISILRLVEGEKAVVEGAGATALAAILAGELQELKGKRVVIPLCGGNIDTTVLGRCLERGLAADGRLVKFTVTVSDRPGGIAELTRLLANLGVSIKDMVHERAWIRSDIFSVEVKVLCETRDKEHSEELRNALLQRYKILRFGSQSPPGAMGQ